MRVESRECINRLFDCRRDGGCGASRGAIYVTSCSGERVCKTNVASVPIHFVCHTSLFSPLLDARNVEQGPRVGDWTRSNNSLGVHMPCFDCFWQGSINTIQSLVDARLFFLANLARLSVCAVCGCCTLPICGRFGERLCAGLCRDSRHAPNHIPLSSFPSCKM